MSKELHDRLGKVNDNICFLLMILVILQFLTLAATCSGNGPQREAARKATP